MDRQILAIALPALAALISEPAMILADTVIVGRLGPRELAGLAAGSTVLTTIVSLCIFLAYGSTATVARHRGAGQPREALHRAVGSMWLAAALGVSLAVFTAVLSGPLAAALSSSADVAQLAHRYLLISAAAVPPMMLVLAATGALRGLLDLRTPLIVAVSANLVNVVATVLLVPVCGLGLPGAAIGLTIAQWGAAGWLTAVVWRRARSAGASLSPTTGEVLRAGLGGLPLLARTAMLRTVLLIATLVAAHLGDTPLAAHQIATSMVTFLAFALDAIAIAGQTLTGTSLGAGDIAKTRALTDRMMWWGACFGLLAGAVTAGAAPWLVRAFSSDPHVQHACWPALVVVGCIQPVSGVVFVLDGVLIGAGDGVYLAKAGLVQLLVYLPAAAAVALLAAGFTWLWAAYALFQLSRLATLWLRQRGGAWLRLGVA